MSGKTSENLAQPHDAEIPAQPLDAELIRIHQELDAELENLAQRFDAELRQINVNPDRYRKARHQKFAFNPDDVKKVVGVDSPPTGSGVNPAQVPKRDKRNMAATPNAAQPVDIPPPAATPAVVVPQPPKGVTMNLPVREDDHQSFVDQYIDALKKSAKIKDIAGHDAALKKARDHWRDKENAQALAVLNDLVKDVEYPGVAAWVLDPADRKYRVEMLGEQYTGMVNLIRQKRQEPWVAKNDEAAIGKLKQRADRVGMEMARSVHEADPDKVKVWFEEWGLLERGVKVCADRIKGLWFTEMEGRWKADLAAAKDKTLAKKMETSLGLPELLELAQMAEVHALVYKARPENKNDEIAQGDFHKKLQVWEMAAIYSYSTADYNEVAKVLRDSKAEDKEWDDKKKRLGACIVALPSGLAKLPPYKGSVVRCNKTVWPELITQITQTGMFTDMSLMSTGKQKVAGFGEIEMHISGIITGKDISMFSLHQTEGEVLFPQGSSFRLTDAEVKGKDGKVTKFSDHKEFTQHVTTDTKVAKLSFVQAG